MITEELKNKTLRILNMMNFGDHVMIADIAPNNPTLFIDVVKSIIDDGNEELEFNCDYTVLQRVYTFEQQIRIFNNEGKNR